MSDTLLVNEIYRSLQGESTFAGLPCLFVRLTACNLRCSYCDTAYAFKEGRRLATNDIRQTLGHLAEGFDSAPVNGHRLPLIEFTGGEPLLQPAVFPLMRDLCEDGWTVLVETSGAVDIGPCDPRVRRIMDIKCPASGESERNRWENIPLLRPADEIKFVIATHQDYAWAKEILARHRLSNLCPVLFSWAAPLAPHQRDPSLKAVPAGHALLTRQELVELIIADRLPVRFQLQMHKFIWPPDQKGV